jgi:hypothetical protein
LYRIKGACIMGQNCYMLQHGTIRPRQGYVLDAVEMILIIMSMNSAASRACAWCGGNDAYDYMHEFCHVKGICLTWQKWCGTIWATPILVSQQRVRNYLFIVVILYSSKHLLQKSLIYAPSISNTYKHIHRLTAWYLSCTAYHMHIHTKYMPVIDLVDHLVLALDCNLGSHVSIRWMVAD